MMSWNGFFFLSPSTFMMENIVLFHDFLMVFLFSILVLVSFYFIFSFFFSDFCLTIYENHTLEFLWTLIPMILVSVIMYPSISLLYVMDSCLLCGYTLSLTGHQWYWVYFYKNPMNYKYISYVLEKGLITLRLVDVDHRLVLPFNFPIRILGTSKDVIHSWTLPSLGVKMDVIPGRINQFCFSLNRSGVFFGQCSEICGAYHSYMPIVLESVSLEDFVSLFK